MGAGLSEENGGRQNVTFDVGPGQAFLVPQGEPKDEPLSRFAQSRMVTVLFLQGLLLEDRMTDAPAVSCRPGPLQRQQGMHTPGVRAVVQQC